MKQGGCGYVAFIHLCKVCGVEEERIKVFQECVKRSKENSLVDFLYWSEIVGRKGECVWCEEEHMITPSIAHLSYRRYQHFVCVIDYGKYVTYYDVDGKKHRVLRALFQRVFTGYIFHMSALKVL